MYKDRVNVGSLSREPVNINWSEKPKVTKESPLVSESKPKRSDHGLGGRSLGPNRRYRLHMMISSGGGAFGVPCGDTSVSPS